MPRQKRPAQFALAGALLILLALVLVQPRDYPPTPTQTTNAPTVSSGTPTPDSPTPDPRPPTPDPTVHAPPPSPHTVRLLHAIDQGYPLQLTVDGRTPLTFVTQPRQLFTDDFQLTLGTDTVLQLATPPRIADARAMSPGGTLTNTRASIAVVGDGVAAVVEHADGSVTALKTHPETGQLHALELPADYAIAACDHDPATGIATATAENPPPTDEEWFAGPVAQLEPDIANAGGIDPGTGRLDKYVEPLPFGQNYDRSLKDMVVSVVLDKDATGSASTSNLTNKASEYLARMANVAAVHEHQLGIKTLVGELLLTPDTDDYTDIPASLGNFRSWVGSNRPRGTYRWNACAKFGDTGTSGGTIGVAYVSALSGGSGVSVNNKGFTHALVAHEVGHNMGSGHSSGGIMNPGIITGARTFFNDVSAGETAAKDIYDHTRSRIYGDATMRHPEQIPFANDDDRTTAVDTVHRFDPTANDDRTVRNGTANTTLTVEEVSRVNPLHAGAVEVDGNELVFTPADGYQGLAHFSYSLRGDVGNGGDGWLHKGDVGMQVGNHNPNALNLTLAPGQHFSFRPSGNGSGNPSITAGPAQAYAGTSRDDRRLVIIRVDADAAGTDTFTFTRGGTPSVVRIRYLAPDDYLVLQDDVFTVDGTGSTLTFNPLVNDQGAGYRAPVNIAPALNIDEAATAFYFRHRFDAGDLSGIVPLTVNFLRDDGLVVYLNGTELFRDNMPAGAVTPDTLAEASTGGADESRYFRRTLNAALLPGLNTLAVEVHQSSATSSDLGFDLALASGGQTLIARNSTWRYLDGGLSPAAADDWTTNVYDPAHFTTTSFGPDASDKHITTYFRTTIELDAPAAQAALDAALRADDGAVVYVNGQEAFRQNMPAGTITASTTASTTAANNGATPTNHTVPAGLLVAGTNHVAVELHQASPTSSDTVFDLQLTTAGGTVALPFNAPWRYLDTGANLGTTWRANAFDDAAWPASTAPFGYPQPTGTWASGEGILGFGDDLETTRVNSGTAGLDLLPGAFRIISATNLTPAKGNLDTSATIPLTVDGQRRDVFTGDLEFTPTPGATGIATIEYTVEDGAGNRRTGTVSVVLPLVEITSPADATTIIDGRNGLVFEGRDLDAGVSFAWSVTGAPDGATVAFETPDAATTAARFSHPGVYTVRLEGTKDTFTTGTEVTVVVEDASLAVSEAGLVAHWTLDEASGIFADDSSSNGLFGTLVNGVPWTTGVLGSAVNFNAGSEYIDLGEHLDRVRDLHQGTVACWFRTNTGSERTIFSASDSGDPLSDFRLYVDDEVLKFKVRGDVGTSTGSVRSSQDVNDNRWHHAAVTVDAGRNATLYLDGEPVASGIRPFLSGVFDLDTLRVGHVVHDGSPEFPFRGDVDDLRLYDRPLSPEEVALLAGAAADRAPYIDLPDTAAASADATFPLGALGPAVTSPGAVPGTLWRDPGGNPAQPNIATATQLASVVDLPAPGTYRLRLTATVAGTTTFDDVVVERTTAPAGSPVALGIAGITTHQNAPDSVVDLAAAFFDPATGDASTLTFSLTGNTDPSLFTAASVDGGNLTLAYDPSASGTTSLTVRAEQPGGLATDTTFAVTVENAAPAFAAQAFAVAEGTPNGTAIGAVRATDADRDPLTFTLVADPSDGAFRLDPTTGVLSVVDTARLDFETGPSLPLTVLVTDPSHTAPGALATVDVNLTDSNEPPALADLNVDLPERSSAGTTVATLSGSDPEGGDLTYAIVGGNTGNAFEVDPDDGFLSVRSSAPLTTATNPRFTLLVQVTDDGDPALTAVATVRVTLESTLLSDVATARYLVPADGSLGTTWRGRSFDDASWTAARYGVGYDTNGDYDDEVRTDLEDRMLDTSSTVYLRSRFTVDDPSTLTKLRLRVKYDDGFVAYLNGVEIAGANDPGSPAWDSAATASHPDGEATQFEDFDVTRFLNRVLAGENVIAFHAMNRAADNSDFLFVPQLVASATGTAGLPDPPVLSTASAVGVTDSTARLRGTLTDNGGQDAALTFVWGTADGGDNPAAWQNRNEVGTATTGAGRTVNLSGLLPGTTYFFNLFGANGGGTAGGNVRSFTTVSVPPDTLVDTGAPATALVPTGPGLGLGWLAASFDDAGWRTGTTGMGYETGSGYEDLIGIDLRNAMFQRNASAYLRVPFDAPDASTYDRLTLRVQYDDGFVAYLNGIEVARRNAPAGQPFFDSGATANHADGDATQFEDIDISRFRGALRPSGNLLALHGLNAGADSSDFLIVPVLEAADLDGTADPVRPALELAAPFTVAGRSASLGGTLTSTGGQRPQITVFWGTADGGSDPAAWQHSAVLDTLAAGDFAATATGLSPETTYHFTARATNTAGATWADAARTFTTTGAAPLTTVLVDPGHPATYLVPTSGSLGRTWTTGDFDDASWSGGNAGFGFHNAGQYSFLLGTDLSAARGQNASVYLRIPFDVADPSALLALTLDLKYDDAFVAYLNGTEVARSTNTTANPAWNSIATATRRIDDAVLFQPFAIPTAAVTPGTNTLAVHLMNRSAGDGELLLVPRLTATSTTPLGPPTPDLTTWAASFGLTGLAALPGADPDADGLTNLAEFGLGTSPVDRTTAPLAVAPSPDGTAVHLTFTRRTAGVTTAVESSSDGATWSPRDDTTILSAAPVPGNPGVERVTLSLPQNSPDALVRLRFN